MDIRTILKTSSKEPEKEDIETQASDKLVTLFEILIQIDRRRQLTNKKEGDVRK